MKYLVPLAAAAFAFTATPVLAQDSQETFVPGEQFMLQWDLNEDGKVTLQEAREKRGDIFTMFDQNDDGIYSADEIALIDEHKAMEREAGKGPGHNQPEGMGQGTRPGAGKGPGKGMGQSKRMGKGQGADRAMMDMPTAKGLAMLDANGDGTIAREEFVAGTDRWFAMRDRNGVITAADFGPAQ
jgi:Ca2+-binding EF-hand superfamily protein